MIKEFQDRDGFNHHDAFQLWRRQNPSGYFLTFKTKMKANLHGSNCDHSGTPDFTMAERKKEGLVGSLTRHKKVCSETEKELLEWSLLNEVQAAVCYHCNSRIEDFISLDWSITEYMIEDPLIEAREEPRKLVPKNSDLPPAGVLAPVKAAAEVFQYSQDLAVKSYVLSEAKGQCEGCARPSPFRSADGEPFLEIHHVKHRAEGGSDRVTNTVALCPNCHKEIHLGENRQRLVARLFESVSRLEKE